MSEPKEHLFVPCSELQEGDELTDAFTIAKSYYLKAEADKVIAELNKKIKLYEDLGSCLQGCPALRHNQRRVESEIYKVKLKEKELCHQKYKRCLAMARWCESEAYIHEHGSEYDEKLVAWLGKWYERWLKIAEQFKEAK